MDIISLAVGIASFVAACAIAFFQKNFAEMQDEESSILQKTYNDNLLKIRCINFIYDNGFINDVFIQRSDNKYYIIISYNTPPVLKNNCFPEIDKVEIEDQIIPFTTNDIYKKINNRIAIEINVNESCYSNWFLPFLVSKRNENNEKLSLNITLHFNLELSKDNKIYIAIKTTLFNTGEYINYSLFPAIAVRQQYVVLDNEA
jgi:ABC-type antimicrobial peptide transport system permease subunit